MNRDKILKSLCVMLSATAVGLGAYTLLKEKKQLPRDSYTIDTIYYPEMQETIIDGKELLIYGELKIGDGKSLKLITNKYVEINGVKRVVPSRYDPGSKKRYFEPIID